LFEQGISAFTANQAMGVQSRFVQFPDEGHWILKPQNSNQWHEEVFQWLDHNTQNQAED
jgi:acylaminoacyl-peptidase